MSVFGIIVLIIAFLVISGIVAMLIYTVPIAKYVYETQLVRTSKEKWGRVCSAPDNEEQFQMWNDGIRWADQYRDRITEVETENDGFHLFGEYFDFGGERCAIILPGRCESLVYSYYFAEPYRRAGFNVLVIDTRCHGKSDGKYNTIGVKESRDVLQWAKLMHEQFGNREVWFHGICIGTSAGIFAMTDKDCPAYIKGFVTEGCYISFRETFKRHMIAEKRPLFPVLDLVMLLINHHTGTNVYKDKPIAAIKKLKPETKVLFLYGKKDIFSIPEKTQQLFDACSATHKTLEWFEQGGHSHIRINNIEQYDNAIVDFFKKHECEQ